MGWGRAGIPRLLMGAVLYGRALAEPFPSSRQDPAPSCHALGWELLQQSSGGPGELGGSLCCTAHCSNTSTTLEGLQHGITGSQGLDIKTNQQRNSLQLCTMRGNPAGSAGSVYMSVDWHSGHRSSSAFAHEGRAAKPWALPGWILSTGSPGTEGQKGKAATGGGLLDTCGSHRGGQQVNTSPCCLF